MFDKFSKTFSIKNITLLFCASFLFLGTTTKASAATYYVSVADGNDTNCTGLALTPYPGSGSGVACPWKTIGKVNAVSFNPDDIILFKGGESFTDYFLWPKTSGTNGHPITFGGCNKASGPPHIAYSTSSSANLRGQSYLVLDGLYFGQKVSLAASESNIRFQNCIFENSTATGIQGSDTLAITDINVDHCVFSRLGQVAIYTRGASTVTVRNTLFLSATVNLGPWDIGTGGNINVDYSIIQTLGTPGSNYTDGGHNVWYPDPKITQYPPVTPVAPHFAITIDDTVSLASFQSLMAALDPYGVKGTIFVNYGTMDADDKSLAQALAADGHEVANHTEHHADLSATQAFTVTTANANPTITVDVANTTITLSTTTSDNTLTLNWSDGKTLEDLETAAAAKGWTINYVLAALNSSTFVRPILLDTLADSGGAQPLSYTVLYDTSAPNYKYYEHEIGDNQTDLATLLGEAPISFSYPFGYSSAGIIDWMEAQDLGIESARNAGGTTASSKLSQVQKMLTTRLPYGWISTDDEATVRQWARRICGFAEGYPAYVVTYEHMTSSAQWTRYAWWVDEIQECGGIFMTYGQLMRWIALDHTDDGTYWTKTYDVSGANYQPLADSPLISAGIATTTATDITGAAYSATPTIGAYQYLSSNNSLTSFNFESPSVTGVVDNNAHTIALTVPFGTDITSLAPTIVITGTSVSPASGAAQNFTSPVIYTVTAENGTTQTYTVTVTVANNTSTSILSANSIGSPVTGTAYAEALQNQIKQLTEQLKFLQSQIFAKNLSLYNTGSDVKLLQQYMNNHGFLISAGGAGSPGNETDFFGLLTYKALQKFQKSVGLPATGFFGPLTRAYIKKSLTNNK